MKSIERSRLFSGVILYFLTVLCFSLQAQNITGIVYLDTNENGIYDSDEKGIENILVTNGKDVVNTNSNGLYNLPNSELTHFVTVHQPADFSVKQFYIKTSENKDSYDFALVPKEKKETVSFVQISDTETFEYRDWLNDLKEYVQQEEPDFTIHTGDICYKKGLIFHSNEVTTEKLGGRMLYCIGNHDLVEGSFGEELYEELLGPVYYSFEEGNTLFIVTPMIHGDYKPFYSKEQVYNWLVNLLKQFPKEQPKYFFNHDVLTQGDIFNYGFDKNDGINLNEYNLKAWVYGHYHSNHIREHGDSGIYSISTGSIVKGGIDHAPSSFRIINVDENGDFTTQLRYSSTKNKITIVAPKSEMTFIKGNQLKVSVNAYHSSSPTVAVRYSIQPTDFSVNWHSTVDDEGWNAMTSMTDWNWEASWNIPNDGFKKSYKIIAEATLNNGHVIRTQEKFKLNKNSDDITLGNNWNNLRKNAKHSGVTTQPIETPLTLQWMQNTGANIFMCSPIYANGLVYIATIDDSNYKNCYVIAYDALTGVEHWRYKVKSSIKNSITYDSGIIVAADSEGITYAIDGQTGELIWEKDLDIHEMPSFVSGLASDDGIVYAGWGSGLHALNVKDGTSKWQNTSWHGGEGSTPTYTVGSNVVVASAHWRALYGHDLETGNLLWERKDEGLRSRDGTASIYDNLLYISARNSLFILNPLNGETIKQRKTGYNHAVSSTPLITENLIIIGTADQGVVAFEKNTLKEVWNFKTDTSLFYTSPYTQTGERTVETSLIQSGNTLYFGASDGYFYALDKKTGSLIWKQEFGVPIFSSVALSGNMLFVADFSGNVYGFKSDK